MMEITATALEQNLAATVNAAAGGQTFTITKHGAPVATLGPPRRTHLAPLNLERPSRCPHCREVLKDGFKWGLEACPECGKDPEDTEARRESPKT